MSEELYKRKKITIKTENNVEKLFIGGKIVETHYNPDSKEYSCNQLPYTNYSLLSKLAKDLIDNNP